MAFKKGVSGNPAGRPKGTVQNKELKEMLVRMSPSVLQVVYDRAIGGDIAACRIILDRSVPTLKSIDTQNHESQNTKNEKSDEEIRALIVKKILDNTRKRDGI